MRKARCVAAGAAAGAVVASQPRPTNNHTRLQPPPFHMTHARPSPSPLSLQTPSTTVLAKTHQTMAVTGLNHFNITASPEIVEQTKRFYRDILGFEVGPRAHLNHSGYWLYAGNSPILHLSTCPDMNSSAMRCRGFFNHISLNCVGLQSTIKRLTATNTAYKAIELSDIGQTQLFITDPAGIGVELTFFDEAL
ncbi:MAG: VOC family protein [Cyanobacteria bacterium J06621_11]